MSKEKELTITSFQPLWDVILVKPFKLEKQSGFVTPKQEEDKAEMGKVIAVPKGIKDFKKGDIVLFNKYSTTKVLMGGEIAIRAEDIIAVKK